MKPFCAAVDWGTTSFRLWLLGSDGRVLGERRSEEGMSVAAERGFAAVMEHHLASLGAPDAIPTVVCGMAGARQGWREAGYLDAPAELRGVLEGAVAVPGCGRDTRILPGVAQRHAERPDVMRGEETQLLGALARGESDGLYCLPGTHSKWALIRDGRLERFATFMTGELFALLSERSILRHSLEGAGEEAFDENGFCAGVRAALEEPAGFSSLIFGLRAGSLLGFFQAEEARARLPGLLIGLEIAGASAMFGRQEQPRLIASGRLAELYRLALRACALEPKLIDADEAVRQGLFAAARALWAGKEISPR